MQSSFSGVDAHSAISHAVPAQENPSVARSESDSGSEMGCEEMGCSATISYAKTDFQNIAKDLVTHYGPPNVNSLTSMMEKAFQFADVMWETATHPHDGSGRGRGRGTG
eukprot:9480163-Pyramimonas_sp.AAC.1